MSEMQVLSRERVPYYHTNTDPGSYDLDVISALLNGIHREYEGNPRAVAGLRIPSRTSNHEFYDSTVLPCQPMRSTEAFDLHSITSFDA